MRISDRVSKKASKSIRTCSALEALRNALYKCSTYLLYTAHTLIMHRSPTQTALF